MRSFIILTGTSCASHGDLFFLSTLPPVRSDSCSSLPQDVFVEEIQLISEDLLSNDLVVEGEYMSETTMKEVWGWSQYLGWYYLNWPTSSQELYVHICFF